MDNINIQVGENLQRIRKSRNLSLDKTAMITGVSKAMLGQIERGTTNPTISVLWKIVNGLKISFTSLIEMEQADITLVHKHELEAFEQGLFYAYPMFPYDTSTGFEWYEVEMKHHCIHTSDPHEQGVQEYLIVQEGEMELDLNGNIHTLHQGSAIRFPAHVPHTYKNIYEGTTRCSVVICYGSNVQKETYSSTW